MNVQAGYRRAPAGEIASRGAAAWFRRGAGITVTGAGVSQWDDQSGSGRHLKQTSDTNRPALQADGSVLFDGVDNFLACDAFTLNQPETIYVLAKQVTWTINDLWFDGNAANSGMLQQLTGSPQIRIFAGSSVGNASVSLDTYVAVAAVFNAASSLLQINNGIPITGNAGAANMGGFRLCASPTPANFGNIQAKEVALFAAAHDAGTRFRINRAMGQLGAIAT